MVLCMVVLGGMGSIPGIVLGAAALIVLPEVFREFELYRMLAFGGAMVTMMLFRPAGLIPAKRLGTRSEEMEG
jgi:branched-chain amino acid transport system permease protein